MTREKAVIAHDILTALPLGAATGIKPDTLKTLLLLKVELQRVALDTETSRRAIIESATEGLDGFQERLTQYNHDPEAHPDFNSELSAVNERFAPAYNELLAEDVEIKRPLMTEEQWADLAATIPYDGPSAVVGGSKRTPIELIEGALQYLTITH